MKITNDVNLEKSGVYIIFNETLNKNYIGQTVNFQIRFKEHLNALKKDKHFNIELQEDYNKGQKLIFKIFSLNRMEKFWIKKYNTYLGFGYNRDEGGNNFGIGKNNPKYDHTIYTFYHWDGRIEKCTQFTLRKKYKLKSGDLSKLILRKGKSKSCYGWGIEKDWYKTLPKYN